MEAEHVLEKAKGSGEEDPFAHLMGEDEGGGGGGGGAGEKAAESRLFATSTLALTNLPPSTPEQLVAFLAQHGVRSARSVKIDAVAGSATVVVGDHELADAFAIAGTAFLGSIVDVALAPAAAEPQRPAVPQGPMPPPPAFAGGGV